MTKIYDQQRFKPPKVGDEVHRLRRAHGLTLDELATKSGVSKAILSQIEHDKSNPTLSTIWRITQALDHPLEDLLSSNKPSSPLPARMAASPSGFWGWSVCLHPCSGTSSRPNRDRV